MAAKKKLGEDIRIETTIDGEYVLRCVTEKIAAFVEAAVDTAVETAVQSAIETRIRALADKDIQAAVKQVLAEGWSKTDDYGRPTVKASLKDRIGEMLRAPDRYQGNGQWLENLVKKETETFVKGEHAAMIKAAIEKMRAEIDEVTRAKLGEALRKALGVNL